MAYHLRIECRKRSSLITTRSRNSELWFINNPALEDCILGYAAKYAERYKVLLYALAIEGNHIHNVARFPHANRASFMRDFNSNVARAVPRYAPSYSGGRLWARRYSSEFVSAPEDIEEEFFYTVLQPVEDGLESSISRYPGYNCFHDAVHGIERKFKVVRWTEYHAVKRHNPNVSIKDFIDTVTLKYERIPGYEHLTQAEYAAMMERKLEERRIKIVQKRAERGLGFVGRERLLQAVPGTRAKKSKTSNDRSHRPRVLSVCPKRRAEEKSWYFDIYFRYREASRRYRAGELDVEFPEGTYRPYTSVTEPGG